VRPIAGEFAADYGPVAHLYDKLEWCLLGTLESTRNALLDQLPHSPHNPIVLACGTGRFPAAFIRAVNPARLTINDIAPEMIAIARRCIAALPWPGELTVLPGEITSLHLPPVYDFVAAQFLLDCFPQRSRVPLLLEIRKLMAPGAALLISGYARPRSPWLLPLFYLNYAAALLGFRILAAQRMHAPGDIERAITAAGFRIVAKRTRFFGLFASWLTI
jgi:ubiquinone/menaquinone biosynthesis C-methylase UbiE